MASDDPYSENQELVESVLAASCRVHRLPADHADEFRSWARLRLVDNDQAILRKFGQRSSLRTYLISVIERLFLDWRNHEWGKWRPSSEARRRGELAVELERLVLRDQSPFAEAAAALVSRGLAASEEECDRVWALLPRRPRRKRVDDGALREVAAAGRSVDPVQAEEDRAQASSLLAALDRVVAALPPRDQTLVRLRYWSGVKVSRIAALTGEDQRQLYRTFERMLAEMRRGLMEMGVDPGALAALGSLDPEQDEGSGTDG